MSTATPPALDAPQAEDLKKCVHCGLRLNACPTYRELGVEMDSPRGRIYQLVQVAEGNIPINDDYVEHIELCLGCRACETACSSGVQYGRLIERALAQIETTVKLPALIRFVRWLVFNKILRSRFPLIVGGYKMLLYQKSGLQKFMRSSGVLNSLGRLGEIEQLASR